jgi:hypothetical protein
MEEKKEDDLIVEGIIVDIIDDNGHSIEGELYCRLGCCAVTMVLLITAFVIDKYIQEFI